MNYQELIHSPILPPGVAKLVQRCARSSVPVFIQGEPGTGKELVAKLIHQAGDWKSSLFYRIDCQLLPADGLFPYLSSLLDKIFSSGKTVTFYLDEVGRLSPTDQLKLLDLMEDNLLPNGLEKKLVQNIRLISSSSENLEERVSRGNFSRNLYLRLKIMSIHIPPLRNRPNEIPSIARYLLEEKSQELKLPQKEISEKVLKLLSEYWWPGNLKELEQVIIRAAILSEGNHIMENDLAMGNGMDKNSFIEFIEKAEMKAKVSSPKDPFSAPSPNGSPLPDASLFFIELVHRIKNPLVSIKTFTQLLRDKFNDAEFRTYFYRIVTEDIEKIDQVLNGLLNYIKVNHPIEKRDTIHSVLEEVLKRFSPDLEAKKIRLFKRFEKNLPETILHEEQLRYILTSLIQYALPSIPLNGTIGILTKSVNHNGFRPEGVERKTPLPKAKPYVQILMVFTGYRKPLESLEPLLGLTSVPQKEIADLEIRLLQEMIERNRGMMTYEVNEKKMRTIISLKLPPERRKVITYPSTQG